jgi:hypothetical protein
MYGEYGRSFLIKGVLVLQFLSAKPINPQEQKVDCDAKYDFWGAGFVSLDCFSSHAFIDSMDFFSLAELLFVALYDVEATHSGTVSSTSHSHVATG